MECRHCRTDMNAEASGMLRCSSCGAWAAPAEVTSRAVSIDREPDRLTIRLAWWTRGDTRTWARLLYLVAFGVFLAFATRFAISTLESYTFLIPIGLLGYLPALALTMNLSQRMRNQTVLVATREGITCSWGPQEGGKREISLEGGHQFYSVDDRGWATVRLMRQSGESAVVARQATPAAALQIERALEAFYGWADRPVAGELPRAKDFAAERKRSRPAFIAHAVAATSLIVIFGYLMTRPAVEGLVAQVDLADEDGPYDVDISLAEARNLEVWVRLEMTFDGIMGSRESPFRDLPRVYRLHIEGPKKSISCDPYEVANLISQSKVTGLSETTVGWFARLDDCRVDLPAGEHELQLQVVSQDQSYRLDRLTVLFLEP